MDSSPEENQRTSRPRRMASRPLPESSGSVPGTSRPRRVATRPPPRRVASPTSQLQLDDPVSKRTRRGNAPVPAQDPRDTLRRRRMDIRPETSGQVPETSGQDPETSRPRRMASRPIPETSGSVPGTSRPPPRRIATQMSPLQKDDPDSKRARPAAEPVPAQDSDSSSSPATPYESSPDSGSHPLIVRRNSDSEESEEGYEDGGYCDINEGDVVNTRYEIIKNLGHGGYSTVWKAKDLVNNQFVALKIAKSHKRWADNVRHEIDIMDIIERHRSASESSKYVPQLLNSFDYTAANGYVHVVMVLELVGENLDKILRTGQRIHIDNIRKICRQVLEGLQFLHDTCGIVHCDLKTDNIMLHLSSEEETEKHTAPDNSASNLGGKTKIYNIDFKDPNAEFIFKIGDFGLARTMQQGEKRVMPSCNYSPPEEFLKGNYGFAVDMWSFACCAYEIVTRDAMFPCLDRVDPSNTYQHYLFHLTDIIQCFGDLQVDHYRTARNKRHLSSFFRANGTFKFKDGKTSEYYRLLHEPDLMSYMAKESNVSIQDAPVFQDFMLGFLKVNPTERCTAQDGLDHQFLRIPARLPTDQDQGNLVRPRQKEGIAESFDVFPTDYT